MGGPSYYQRALRVSAHAAGIKPGELNSPSRKRHIVHARWAVWINLHRRGMSNSSIANLAQRDQSTVKHGITEAKWLEGHNVDFSEAVKLVRVA